jgi:hypothetical protein
MFTPRAVLLLTAAKLPHHHGEHILNKFLDALKVDSGGSASDEAVTRPCLVALSCLTPDFYEHLHVSVQEQVFGTLILLSSSTLVDIHSAAHGVLHNLKVLPAHFSIQVSLC